ncbi:MAG: O-antigen ligase family protein, partial [Acidobacteriota bacterium]
ARRGRYDERAMSVLSTDTRGAQPPTWSRARAVHSPLVRPRRRTALALRLTQWLALHVALAFAMRAFGWVATVHALGCLAAGLMLLRRPRAVRGAMPVLIVYIAACELLWRGSAAPLLFYEFGKYSIILLLGLALLQDRRQQRRLDPLPALYFALLTPSILVMPIFDRQAIAFNLSGPLVLAVAMLYFRRRPIEPPQVRRILLAVLGPCAGLAALATFTSLNATAEQFYQHGKVGSGGFPPNQMSSMLGLGALAAFLLIVRTSRRARITQLLLLAVLVWLLGQSALTLSRGGFWTAVAGGLAATFFLLQQRDARSMVALRLALVAALGALLVYPFIDGLTGGTLGQRFQSFDTTGRADIMRGDLLAFEEQPLLGVGPGQASVYHARVFRESSAHTEYTRLLAEHGLFGAAALLLLLSFCVRRALQRPTVVDQATVAALTVWSLLFMVHAAMRLAAPGLAFGLAAARLVQPRPSSPPAPAPRSNARPSAR